MSEAACGFHHDGTGCKIRHGIGLQQVGPKPLIQAAVTGKCAEAKCRFDHCLPRLRAASFIAASALSVD